MRKGRDEGKFVFEPEHIVRCEGELNFPEVSKMRKKMRAANRQLLSAYSSYAESTILANFSFRALFNR